MSEIIEGWVVLETVSYEHQAEMIRSQLEEAGIPCTVYSQKDSVNVVFVGDLSEIKILVHQDQVLQAREVIKDIELPEMEIAEDADVGECDDDDDDDDEVDEDEDDDDEDDDDEDEDESGKKENK
jgi:hypothetical protein